MPDSPARRAERAARNIAHAVEVPDALKLTAGCADCGYRRTAQALQFDHVDPATKLRQLGWQEDRSKLTTASKLRRYLDHVERYCVIRCANCHAERTFRERHYSTRRYGHPTLI